MPDPCTGSTPHREQDPKASNPKSQPYKERQLKPISTDTANNQQNIFAKDRTVEPSNNTISRIRNGIDRRLQIILDAGHCVANSSY